jgi:hypothetical protein
MLVAGGRTPAQRSREFGCSAQTIANWIGAAGVRRRRGFVVTAQRDERQRRAPDLVQREFTACGPNRL